MTVKDLARKAVVAEVPQTPVADLAELMRTEDVGSVVIEDVELDETHPVGIVTDRDLVIDVMSEGRDPHEVRASDVMTRDPVTIEADAGVLELTELMAEHGVRRVPVVDDGQLHGLVALDDLTRLFSDELGNLAAVIEAESPSY